MSDEASTIRREVNERLDRFEERMAPFVERTTVALERIAATEQRVAEHAMRTDTTFGRVFDKIDSHEKADVAEHQKLRAEIAEVRTVVAVEQPQNGRTRRLMDLGLVGAAVFFLELALRKLGLMG